MAAKKKAAKAGAGAFAAGKAVRSNQYVQRIMEDDELRENLRSAFVSAKKAYGRVNGKGRLLLLAVVGAAAALALSEGLRKKVLDALFGAEEEFEYTATTTPAPDPTTTSSSEPVNTA